MEGGIVKMTGTPRSLPVIQAEEDSVSPPLFEKIAIIGLGLIGGSIALAARQSWPSGLVIGVDRKEVLEKAMVLHAIDVAADDPFVISEADLVILAAPVEQNIELLAQLDRYVEGTALVTDVGSTKRTTLGAAAVLPERLTFIGGHPLGGAPRGGIDYARPDLFKGRPWIFTPTHDSPAGPVERLSAFVEIIGAQPHVMDPDEHDRLLAFVSHLPQLVASALMHVVGSVAQEKGLGLTGRGLFDATRLASSPADIWLDICSSNSDEIAGALDQLIGELRKMQGSLNSSKEIDRVFSSAAKWRSCLAALRRPTGVE